MFGNMLDKILLIGAAIAAVLFGMNRHKKVKEIEVEYEETFEVAKEIKHVQRTGDVRDRMHRAGWIKPDATGSN